MKLYYTSVFIIALAISFASCKKASTNALVIGKWHETKLRLYEVDSSKTIYDTTYLAPFTNLDYVQFTSNGTCYFSADHYFYPNHLGYPTTPQAIPQSIDTIAYNNAGDGKYIIFTPNQPVNFSGFVMTDTAFVTGNTMRIQVINYGISKTSGYESITDSYYERSTP
jgi:hypothetical protein